MKLCLSGRLWESPKGYSITLHEFLATAAELGYQGIELRYPMIPPPEKLEAIRNEAKRLGVTVVFSTCAALPRDDATRKDAIRVLDTIVALGGHDIRATMGSDDDYAPMRTLADMASEKGIKVVMQIHINTLCDTVERTEQCLKKLNHPNMRLTYDPIHLGWMGDRDMAASARRLKPWIVRANVQNYAPARSNQDPRQKIQILGKDWLRALPGDPDGLDHNAYFKALRGIGFDGWINVMCDVDPSMTSKAVAKQNHDLLSPLLSAS